MQRAIRRSLQQCTCRARTACSTSTIPIVSRRRFLSSTSTPGNDPIHTASPPSTSTLPWFVDPSTAPSPSSSSTTSPSPTKLSLEPPPPPHDLPSSLHGLHAHLSISPFLQGESVKFINAREADPEAWTDWVVLASLKKSREGGLRGAVEGVKTYLTANPVDTGPAPPSQPFAPPSAKPLVTGIPTAPSKHARARKASPSRAEQASGWGLVDAGTVVVHIQTEQAREDWGLELLWEGIKRENARKEAVLVEQN